MQGGRLAAGEAEVLPLNPDEITHQPWPEPIQKPGKQLNPKIESGLSLTLNTWGDTEPVRQF